MDPDETIRVAYSDSLLSKSKAALGTGFCLVLKTVPEDVIKSCADTGGGQLFLPNVSSLKDAL